MYPVGGPPGSGAWVFSVGTERGALLSSARYKFDHMLIKVVASPLRVLLDRCRG